VDVQTFGAIQPHGQAGSKRGNRHSRQENKNPQDARANFHLYPPVKSAKNPTRLIMTQKRVALFRDFWLFCAGFFQ
jgi:hypothetical protein